MNIVERSAGISHRRFSGRILASLLPAALMVAAWPLNLPAQAPQDDAAPTAAAPAYVQQSPEQLQQLVAPIALYPDSLVAQILAASTFPDQVVVADRWVQAHPDLQGQALGQAVDQQAWDPSVKALTAFPTVLGNMDKNLSWTSSLGDAYYNQQQDVMSAVQTMRQRAQAAGNLNSTPQQTVSEQDSNIVIEPTDPQVVYVPAYDPWVVYGDPLAPWPFWYPYPGIWFDGPYLSFGFGFGIGFFGGFGWGWGNWAVDWHHHFPLYHHDRYVSHSNTFYNRNAYYRGGGQQGVATNVAHGAAEGHGEAGRAAGGENRAAGASADPFGGNRNAARGYAEPRGESGEHSGAFSGYDHGGQARGFSSRGSSSMGGGGHMGGGGAHMGGGGGHGGGGGIRH